MTDKPPRKHNPAWRDPPENRAARQRKRLDALNEIAQALGFETWRRLETAALRGDVVLTVTHSDSKVYILMTDGEEQLNEIAQSLGFETWRRLETAVKRGDRKAHV